MSYISTDEIARIADLAHIALTPEEIERITDELDIITAPVAKVFEVTTADIPAASHATPLANIMREDVVSPTLDREEVLSQALASEEGVFLAPQILEEE